MTNNSNGSPSRKLSLGQISFFVFMGGLTILFCFLSNWQFNRLVEKEALIAAIESRASLPPSDLPALAEWNSTDPEAWSYAPVKFEGRFLHEQTVLTFTSLPSTNGVYSGHGFWVVTPMELDHGGVIFVNRGFIPQELEAQFRGGGLGASELVQVSGLARLSERPNLFTPEFDALTRTDYVRNIDRLKLMTDLGDRQVAPFTVDLDAQSSTLPQGGETKLTVTNRHLDYALTWLALAIITPLMSLFWWLRERRKAKQTLQS